MDVFVNMMKAKLLNVSRLGNRFAQSDLRLYRVRKYGEEKRRTSLSAVQGQATTSKESLFKGA